MNTTFVTCIYYDLYETEFNGRTSRTYHYLYSLRNILNTNVNVVLYTDASHIEQINKFIEPSHNKNIKIIPLTLKDTYYYNRLKDYKTKHVLEPMRCYEIMYSKTDWLKDTIKNNPFNNEFFYWIDSGLSHHGLFPQAYRRNNTGDQQYDQWYNYSLFNEEFVDRVLKQNKEKSLIFNEFFPSYCEMIR